MTSSLSGVSLGLGWIMGILIAVVAFTSGLTWIMGSDRTLAVSCYDGAGPRLFGKFSARFGTPLRVNVLSGVVSTVVFVTTPDHGRQRVQVLLGSAEPGHLDHAHLLPWHLPGRTRPAASATRRRPALLSPWIWVTTILSTVAIVFCTVETLFPGLGDGWFSSNYLPSDQWKSNEKWTFLLTDLVPLALFAVISVAFWYAGKRHRERELRGDGRRGPALLQHST